MPTCGPSVFTNSLNSIRVRWHKHKQYLAIQKYQENKYQNFLTCIPQPAVDSSSLPLGQSLSPSQSQCWGTQACEPKQLNVSAAQVTEPEKALHVSLEQVLIIFFFKVMSNA